MKCQHDWKKIAETTLPSGFEQMEKGGLGFDKISGVNPFKKKYILVLFCKKCGKLVKFTETNPG